MLKRLCRVAIGLCVFVTPAIAGAWDGTDSESGEEVTIESGHLVRSGLDIEVYDYGDGAYHDVTVERIQRSGSGVEMEVYDQETGETRTLEMDAE